MITITLSTLVITLLVLGYIPVVYYFLKDKSNLVKIHESRVKELTDTLTNQERETETQLAQIEALAKEHENKLNTAYGEALQSMQRSVDLYEKYIIGISNTIKLTDDKLRELDHKGTFKSDDEIGFFFENVKGIQDLLNTFKVELINHKEIDDKYIAKK